MLQTDNYGLNIVEGTDKVNPLTQLNPNFETIDEQMKANELATVGNATELTTGTVHAITRGEETPVFRFTATSIWHSGDTMTVDGIQVSVLTTSGETVPEGAYIIGAEVVGILKGTVVTLYYTARKVAEATNAEKLNGEGAEYYATKVEVDNAQTLAEAGATLAQSANELATTASNEIAQTKAIVDSIKFKKVFHKEVSNVESEVYAPIPVKANCRYLVVVTATGSSVSIAQMEILMLATARANKTASIFYKLGGTDLVTAMGTQETLIQINKAAAFGDIDIYELE